MLKKLFIKIFKRKEYLESLEVMDKLLGIEKINNFLIPIEIFSFWIFNGRRRLVSLDNYKNMWDKPRYKISWKSYGNVRGMCYNFDFYIEFRYYAFNYAKFNF